jgi:RNA polymerase sigma factor (TIGR02999 family)
VAKRTPGKPPCDELLSIWGRSAFSDPAPTELVQAVRDHVRRAYAARLAAGTIDQEIQQEQLEHDVGKALGEGLRGEAAEAFSRLARRVVQEITVESDPQELTRLLWMWKTPECSKDAAAIEERLFVVLQTQLYNIAARKLAYNYKLRNKIEVCELLSELYLHLRKANIPHLWENRRQFYAMAGKALDNIIKDMLKASHRDKRFKSSRRVALTSLGHPGVPALSDDYLACREALSKLGQISPRQKEVMELRWFHDLPVEEVAATLNLSAATVKRDSAFAEENIRKLLGVTP